MDKAYNGWANWETWSFIKDVREKSLDFSRGMNHELVIFFPCNNPSFNV